MLWMRRVIRESNTDLYIRTISLSDKKALVVNVEELPEGEIGDMLQPARISLHLRGRDLQASCIWTVVCTTMFRWIFCWTRGMRILLHSAFTASASTAHQHSGECKVLQRRSRRGTDRSSGVRCGEMQTRHEDGLLRCYAPYIWTEGCALLHRC